MTKVMAFNKDKFTKEELEEKTTEELYDLRFENPCDVEYFDKEDYWKEALNNGELENKILMFIESEDIL